LAAGTANTFNGPINFLEYDYISNTFTQVSSPSTQVTGAAPYYTKFLQLPNGTVLFNDGSPQLYCYTPDGTPVTNGVPVISSILQNADGSFHLTGFGLNGISAGAAYGDDAQMDSNFPIVRMTNNSTGNVYYGRTYNWTSTGVMTSNTLVSTEFVTPTNFPAGTYSLVAVANGNPSAPVPFTVPLVSPTINNVSLSDSVSLSTGNLVLTCGTGLAGRTYYLLTSTDPAAPLSAWTPISTNVLSVNGAFTLNASNIVNFGEAQRYFMLEAQ
jgi:hypothetical protein